MTLRLQSQLTIDSLADPAIVNNFEVVMPTLRLNSTESSEKKKNADILDQVWAELSSQDYTPIVEQISFGVMNFGTANRRVRTGWINVPDDIQNYQDVSITMYCSIGMLTQYYLESWKRLVFNPDGEYYNQANVYKRNIEVYFYGTGNVGEALPVAAHYTLVGCFPTTQTPYDLKYAGNPERLRLTQKFKMDKIIFDAEKKKSSIVEELVGAPLSLADKAISGLSSSASNYNLNSTY